MRMIIVHHKDAKEPILVPECDLPSFAEKGWHPAKHAERLVLDPAEESENIVDSEEI
jgi:hypothetical protein